MAQKAPYWALINFSSFLFCLIELKYSFLPSLLSIIFFKRLISFFEIFLMFLFFVNFLYNIYIFIYFKKFTQPIELTSEEFTLFGISDKEIGFKLKDKSDSDPNIPNKNKNKLSLTPTFDITPNSIIGFHSSVESSPLSTTRLFNDSSQMEIKSTSWAYIAPQNDSFSRRSDTKLNKSFDNSLKNELRFRKSKSFLHNWNNDSSVITSKSTLQSYLQEQEERNEEIEELIQAQKRYGSPSINEMNSLPHQNHFNSSSKLFHDFNSITSKNVSFSNSNNPFNDSSKLFNTHGVANISPSLATSLSPSYKPAIKICSQPSSAEKSESLNSSTRLVEKILAKLDVDDACLNQMIENIRKWISQTILVRLVQEIESINKMIIEKSYIDSLIGETSIKQLKYLAENKRLEFPTLEKVCPFLDVNNVRNIENNIPFQQYLVRRIKDLAKGGCMIEFLWDGGGNYNYKPWKDNMITDTEIILHVFCVYMDSRLLFNPTIPEGKPFSNQYFKPFQCKNSPKSDTYIQQDKAYPPQYSLLLKGEHFGIPPGRNNLFHTLLVFIHHIQVKNFGLLGRINLGPSGLNIAWVIEKK